MCKITTALVAFFFLLLCSCTTIKTSQGIIPETIRTFSASYEEVYAKSVSSLMALQWQIAHSDKGEGLIQARTPMTLWTWGDLLTVHIVQEEQGNVRVDVTSGSPQQFDWGKNRRNIEAFYSELHSRITQ